MIFNTLLCHIMSKMIIFLNNSYVMTLGLLTIFVFYDKKICLSKIVEDFYYWNFGVQCENLGNYYGRIKKCQTKHATTIIKPMEK
jgi:hypothetical protein